MPNSTPKPPRKRCQALDINGKQCRKAAAKAENYHGNGEIYNCFNNRPTWVRVNFCREHLERA